MLEIWNKAPPADVVVSLYVAIFDAAATTPKGEGWKKLRRKGRMANGGDAPGTPRSPTVYDWWVLRTYLTYCIRYKIASIPQIFLNVPYRTVSAIEVQ